MYIAQDEYHLNLLATFHYVVAALAFLFGLIPIIHLTVGLVMLLTPEKFGKEQPPPLFAWMFVIVASFAITFLQTLAVLMLITGRSLAKRKRYRFCFIVACVECIFTPFGTVLGIFTILVLVREPVKAMFAPPSEFVTGNLLR
ncbi:MAG: hypothetical protein ACJ8C4_20840 [Gemmataceae bacterium]